ncbi:hypothetical protein B0T22DRAFT_138544 [Podospora appendiculata]|uniref:Uncharacterized protein n=1 Tax=Podospora appendiculata TaxID=314037 RepID=A0AAE0X8S6_9PEZI|nr:hypothetical protein B0T22DRAFT_138544 [Podospora appendiculata]
MAKNAVDAAMARVAAQRRYQPNHARLGNPDSDQMQGVQYDYALPQQQQADRQDDAFLPPYQPHPAAALDRAFLYQEDELQMAILEAQQAADAFSDLRETNARNLQEQIERAFASGAEAPNFDAWGNASHDRMAQDILDWENANQARMNPGILEWDNLDLPELRDLDGFPPAHPRLDNAAQIGDGLARPRAPAGVARLPRPSLARPPSIYQRVRAPYVPNQPPIPQLQIATRVKGNIKALPVLGRSLPNALGISGMAGRPAQIPAGAQFVDLTEADNSFARKPA